MEAMYKMMKTVFDTFELGNKSISLTNSGQCRLAAIAPCVNDVCINYIIRWVVHEKKSFHHVILFFNSIDIKTFRADYKCDEISSFRTTMGYPKWS